MAKSAKPNWSQNNAVTLPPRVVYTRKNTTLVEWKTMLKEEMTKLRKMEFYGMPFNKMKSMLQLETPMEPKQMEGIPVGDSLHNELSDWVGSVVRAYSGESMDNINLLVKGDNAAKYPTFKFVKDAFKRNDIFKFKIVTNPEGVPADSELALNPPKK